jgi:hypothetical protein
MITVYFLEDSTFDMVTCCPPFTQIVFLQAKIGDKRPLPAAFALLTRKVSFFLYSLTLAHREVEWFYLHTPHPPLPTLPPL